MRAAVAASGLPAAAALIFLGATSCEAGRPGALATAAVRSDTTDMTSPTASHANARPESPVQGPTLRTATFALG